MLTVAPIGKTNRVTRRSNFNVSSKHRNVTGNDAALIKFFPFSLYLFSLFRYDLTLNQFQCLSTKLEAFLYRMQMDCDVLQHRI